jgi:hypothetical protein
MLTTLESIELEAKTIYNSHFLFDKNYELFNTRYYGCFTKLEALNYYCNKHDVPYLVVTAINHNLLWFNLTTHSFLAVRSDLSLNKYHVYDNEEF